MLSSSSPEYDKCNVAKSYLPGIILCHNMCCIYIYKNLEDMVATNLVKYCPFCIYQLQLVILSHQFLFVSELVKFLVHTSARYPCFMIWFQYQLGMNCHFMPLHHCQDCYILKISLTWHSIDYTNCQNYISSHTKTSFK